MRKILWVGVFILLLASKTWAGENFGTFGTATEVDDTCRLCFDTFDTLGHSANPLGDSIYVLRFVRGTLVDSTAASKLREYAWCVTKKAYDGSNLGQYTVFCYWRPCAGKWYNDISYYSVEPETVSYARGDTIQRDASTFDASATEVRIVSTDTAQANLIPSDSLFITDSLHALHVTVYAVRESTHVLHVESENMDGWDPSDLESYIELTVNRKNVYVKTDGDDDSSGLTWQAAKASPHGALGACAEDHCYIFVAPGNYSDSLTIPDDRIYHFIGSGAQVTKIFGFDGHRIFDRPAIPSDTSWGVEIKGFTLSYSSSANSANIPIDLSHAYGFKITDNIIHSVYKGIYIASTSGSGEIRNNRIFNSNWDGIQVAGDRNLITENFVDSTAYSNADGIGIAGNDNLVCGNHVWVNNRGISILSTGKRNIVAFNTGFSHAGVDSVFGQNQQDENLFAGNHVRSQLYNNNTIQEDLAQHIIRVGTAQAGAATSITLDASASAIDDFYKLCLIHLVDGTGANQSRLMTGYNGTSKVATVYPAWKTNPDNTSVFRILPASESEGGVIKIHR